MPRLIVYLTWLEDDALRDYCARESVRKGPLVRDLLRRLYRGEIKLNPAVARESDDAEFYR